MTGRGRDLRARARFHVDLIAARRDDVALAPARAPAARVDTRTPPPESIMSSIARRGLRAAAAAANAASSSRAAVAPAAEVGTASIASTTTRTLGGGPLGATRALATTTTAALASAAARAAAPTSALASSQPPPPRGFASAAAARLPAAPLTPEEIKTKSDDIQDAFAEAREEIEAAMEATGTTYFNEEAEYARECVEKVLGEYYALCDALPEGDRAAFQRANGMKMEQLKAELKQIDHAHDDH